MKQQQQQQWLIKSSSCILSSSHILQLQSMHPCSSSSSSSFLIFSSLIIIFLNRHSITATHIFYPSPPYHNCTSNNTYSPNSTYHTNLQTLLSLLSSNSATTSQIYRATVGNTSSSSSSSTVYGLFMCRIGDGTPNCRDCVINSTNLITKLCPLSKEAILWSDNCFLRYSDRYFFTTVEESPKLSFMNEQDYQGQVGLFNRILWDTMNDVRNLTASVPPGSIKYGYKSVNVTANQTLYAMAYCVMYLSSDNCSWCLGDAIAEIPTSCCRGKSGGRVLFPSCGIRYELYPFYHPLTSVAQPNSLPPLTPNLSQQGKRRHSHSAATITIAVVPVVVVSLVLLYLGCSCFLSRRQKKNHETILKENFGDEVTTLESLRFHLADIESATNKFSKENMIGKGGFGEVYKGVLSNGQEIAVKRLLGGSEQGAEEFKNEVLVIAQLQHRYLVKLQGFCLDGQEKILVYEYVPNKSLDYFLFDFEKRRLLNWSVRYHIITGIARGIVYLHEDSRLKIIHRDLKPSNILLDNNMNPKISDFGIARIIGADNIEVNTHRIVGTYGYMSPEYAMQGQFSAKSDVYSFGVMVLEIISGKKRGFSSDSNSVDDIQRYAWTKWRDQMLLELLDSKLEGPYSQDEVLRCIHIGLLCIQEDPNDRPTMAKVVSCLYNPSVELPLPTEQSFFMNRRLLESFSDSNYESTNGVTVSDFYPR